MLFLELELGGLQADTNDTLAFLDGLLPEAVLPLALRHLWRSFD